MSDTEQYLRGIAAGLRLGRERTRLQAEVERLQAIVDDVEQMQTRITDLDYARMAAMDCLRQGDYGKALEILEAAEESTPAESQGKEG